MIIDESIKRVSVGNTKIQKIISGGVFCGVDPILGKCMN